MQTPLQLTFEGIEHSDPIAVRVAEEAGKLEQFHDRITSMRVVVARPQHRHQHGDHYQVCIHITVPGGSDVAVSREPAAGDDHGDMYATIRDAFKAARRQLQGGVLRRQEHP